jgi:hypothetical protein
MVPPFDNGREGVPEVKRKEGRKGSDGRGSKFSPGHRKRDEWPLPFNVSPQCESLQCAVGIICFLVSKQEVGLDVGIIHIVAKANSTNCHAQQIMKMLRP